MRLQEGEEIIHELKPEPAILVIWFFSKGILLPIIALFILSFVTVFSGILRAFINTASNEPEPSSIFSGPKVALIATIAIIFLVLGLIYYEALRRTYIYFITNQRCVFKGGIFRRIERSIPYHKITDVEISQNIVETILGISRIQIFTPGTGSIYPAARYGRSRGEIIFSGLKDSETPAAAINETLRKFKATGE